MKSVKRAFDTIVLKYCAQVAHSLHATPYDELLYVSSSTPQRAIHIGVPLLPLLAHAMAMSIWQRRTACRRKTWQCYRKCQRFEEYDACRVRSKCPRLHLHLDVQLAQEAIAGVHQSHQGAAQAVPRETGKLPGGSSLRYLLPISTCHNYSTDSRITGWSSYYSTGITVRIGYLPKGQYRIPLCLLLK